MEWKGVIVAVCSLIVAAVSVTGLMQLTEYDEMHVPVVDTVSKDWGGWDGGGSYPDAVDDARKKGEVFDSTLYYTSFDRASDSEKIIVRGQITRNDDWWSCILENNRYQYRYYVWDTHDGDGKSIDGDANWDVLASIEDNLDGVFEGSIPGTVLADEINLLADDFVIHGLEEDGATLRVHVQLYCAPVLGVGGGWKTVAIDEARLIQGDGTLDWSKARYTVGVDDYAKLDWYVPAVESRHEIVGGEAKVKPAYWISIVNVNTGGEIYNGTVEKKTGTIKIGITSDMSVPMGENRLKARLHNAIFNRAVTHAPVAILGGHCAPGDETCEPPIMNSVTSDKAKYFEGEKPTITIDATPGSYPIDHYYLLCDIAGTEIVNIETENSVYQFQVSTSGTLKCEATAYDRYGNPSEMRSVSARATSQSFEEWCKEHPSDPTCTIAEPGLDWLEGLIIALLVVALVAALVLEAWILGQIGLEDWRVSLVVIGLTVLAGLILISMKLQEYMQT